MKKTYHKIILSILGAGSTLGILLFIDNNSYANEASDLADEAIFASEAYGDIDDFEVQAAMVAGIAGIGSVNVDQLQGLDLEAALMAVQSQRANLLEEQLTSQLNAVQAKNEEIARLNEELNALRQKLATFSADDTSEEKQALEAKINELKTQIDNASNSQQMDMLRLQSLSNKRNEAFDVMTNFIKKMQDSRSSIIGNMR